MIKNLIKSVLRAAAPQHFAALSSERANRHGQRVLARHGVPAIAEKFIARHGLKVQSGPFAGMNYLRGAIGSSFVPKLIGSYESELHPALKTILGKHYDVVIDVGSAEGYYAVGLAMQLPGSPITYAFDTDKQAQQMCREMSQLNGVEDRVRIGGYCDLAGLEAALKPSSLVICDCEGYELILLDPTKVPSLLGAEIVVELHDSAQQSITPTIQARFAASHRIEIIDTAPRDPAAYPGLHFLSPNEQQVALSEFRHGPQQWAVMTPKN